MNSITFRVPQDIKQGLDELCLSTKRTQSSHIKEALEEYLRREAWQLSEIKKALQEADAGDFATAEEMQELDEKWKYYAH